MPNLWRIVINCMEIWLAVTEGDMIRVDKFTYLYHLKESKKYGYYELVPWVKSIGTTSLCPGSGWLGSSSICPRPSDTGNLGSFLCLGTIGRLLPMNSGVTFLGCFVVGEPRV